MHEGGVQEGGTALRGGPRTAQAVSAEKCGFGHRPQSYAAVWVRSGPTSEVTLFVLFIAKITCVLFKIRLSMGWQPAAQVCVLLGTQYSPGSRATPLAKVEALPPGGNLMSSSYIYIWL